MNESKLPIDATAPTESAAQTFVPSPSAEPRTDRLATTDQLVERPAVVRADSLSPEAIAMYRGRLARGYYASPVVMRALAERLLESGDL